MDKVAEADAKPEKSFGRFIGILAIFALIGPILGAAAVSAYLGFEVAGSDLMTGKWDEAAKLILLSISFGTLFAWPIAYFIGILPAIGVGLAVALWDMRGGMISWRVAFAVALISWLLFMTSEGSFVEASEGIRTWQISLLLAHLTSAGVCWAIARAVFRRAAAPEVSESKASR